MVERINGVPIYYEAVGQGPPVVLVHGNGEDHHIFDALAHSLQKRYTVYLPDSRDHGQSGRVEQLHYADMAADMAGLITRLGLQKPVFIGFSDGGIVGLLLAIHHPGLLEKLVVCGANTSPAQLKSWFRLLLRLELPLAKDSKVRLMLTEPDITPEQLAAIRTPTLVLAGRRDILPEKDTRAIAAAIPNAVLRILPGENHVSYLKDHRRLLAVAKPFLERG